ncbi:MAG: Asp-tRNA(Asn)/Glu-tRNA(Gln) amidotransferase subunit GatC [Candidatus Nitrosotenuis sp.]
MITTEDIQRIAKLMRIDIDDVEQYLVQTQKILQYFDSLDKANTESEDLIIHETTINDLREDQYIPFDEKLIEHIKSYKGRYVRAPKMN